MRKLALLALIALALVASAQDQPTLRQQAETAFASGQFLQSAALYRQAAGSGESPSDSWYRAAVAYARAGNRDLALEAIEKADAAGYATIAAFRAEAAFVPYRGDARWMKIDRSIYDRYWAWSDRMLGTNRFYDGPALRTDFQEAIPLDERIGGLSKLWAHAKYIGANMDLNPALDWDQAYADHLPLVRNATSTRQYFDVLRSMVALIGDGVTSVYPRDGNDFGIRFAPLRTERVAGKVIVRQSGTPSVEVGAELVAIDGVPVARYAAERIRPLINAATEHQRQALMYGPALLEGEGPARLTVIAPSGKHQTLDVERNLRRPLAAADAYTMRHLDAGVVLLTITRLTPEVETAFNRDWPQIENANGLILDLRLCGSGDEMLAYRLIGALTQGEIPMHRWELPTFNYQQRAWSRTPPGTAPSTHAWFTSDDSRQFGGPIVLLAGPLTAGPGEQLLISLRAMGRARVVGSATAGVPSGVLAPVTLPGGLSVGIQTYRVRLPDNSAFVGVGVPPDVPVESGLDDSPLLERAIAEIRR
jgi:carboxyl-terminal processing protease